MAALPPSQEDPTMMSLRDSSFGRRANPVSPSRFLGYFAVTGCRELSRDLSDTSTRYHIGQLSLADRWLQLDGRRLNIGAGEADQIS